MKKIVLLFVLLFLSITAFPQERSAIINVGCSDRNDLSILVGGRFLNSNLYSSIEYSHNQRVNKDNSLIGIGIMNNIALISVKAGICYSEYFDIPTTQHSNATYHGEMKSEFDYGLEYLWIAGDINQVTFCYGISATRMNGLQIKFGLAF